jgi:hypothetical protein
MTTKTERIAQLEADVISLTKEVENVVEEYGKALIALNHKLLHMDKVTTGLLAGIRWHSSV